MGSDPTLIRIIQYKLLIHLPVTVVIPKSLDLTAFQIQKSYIYIQYRKKSQMYAIGFEDMLSSRDDIFRRICAFTIDSKMERSCRLDQ